MRLPPIIKKDFLNDQTRVSRIAKVTFQNQVNPVVMKEPAEFWHREFLLNESAILEEIRHPRVRRLIAFEPETCRLFLEFIDSPTLKDLIATKVYQAQPERIHGILTRLAETVADLHEGVLCTGPIVHGDLKPCNLMILPGDEVKLIDFSHAYKPTQKPSYVSARDNNPIGTAKYLSPERWECDYSKGKESDVFAFGVLGYVAATGQYPFEGDPAQLEKIIKTNQPVSPLKLNVPISRNLASIITDCLIKEPSRRPSMRHVANALQISQQAITRSSIPLE